MTGLVLSVIHATFANKILCRHGLRDIDTMFPIKGELLKPSKKGFRSNKKACDGVQSLMPPPEAHEAKS